MKFSRRNFLQGVTASIATIWGWENLPVFSPTQLDAYAATINDNPTARKLALLVGIDKYASGNSNLKGCKTDVELQKLLLIHRFGFQPEDILIITDEKATRDNIITSFNQHLQQATKDDVVVFHFSGYGRNVLVNNPDSKNITVKSIITYDTMDAKNNQVDDILLDTMISLAENLNTKKYTLVFDTSFSSASNSIQKQISLRGYQYNPQVTIAQTVLDFQQQLNPQYALGITNSQQKSSLSGIVLYPTTENIAVEINTNNFHAGLFTYTLTQSMWTTFKPIDNTNLKSKIATKISLYSNQLSQIELSPQDLSNSINYHLSFSPKSQGIGIISNINPPNNVEVKLLGLPLLILLNYTVNSILKVKNIEGKDITIKINSISGNTIQGTVNTDNINLIKKGLVVQELLRILPEKLGLNIGLNNNLTKIEKVDATSALSTIGVVSAVSTIGNNFVDYILDKSDEKQGYSLFSPTGVALKYTNPTSEHEGIHSAVKRFEDFNYLNTDLAYKLLNLTYNEYSSTLAVTSTVEVNYNDSVYKCVKSTSSVDDQSQIQNDRLINIPQNSSINIKIDNQNQEDLYFMVLDINPVQEISVFNSPELKLVTANKTKTLPKNSDSIQWFINDNKGLGELIIICSKSPLTKTFESLRINNGFKAQNEQILSLKNSANMAKSVLEDLHQINNVAPNTNDVYALNMNSWVTFSFVYQIT